MPGIKYISKAYENNITLILFIYFNELKISTKANYQTLQLRNIS